ncbi:hypothetical protein KAU08_12905, partial [bacterium]|nr:hypothetical protein [bacterium]
GNSDTNVAGYEYVIVIEYPDDPPVSDEIAWVFDRLRELRDEVLVHPQFNRFEPMPFELLNDIFNYNWSLSFRTFYNDDPTCPMSISLFFLDKGDEGYEVTASADTFVCSRERYHYDFPSIQEFEDILVYIRENSEFFFDYSEFEGADPDRYIQPESDEYFILSAYNSKSRGINVSNLISTEFTDDPPVPDEVAWVFDRLRELRDEILLHPQ